MFWLEVNTSNLGWFLINIDIWMDNSITVWYYLETQVGFEESGLL